MLRSLAAISLTTLGCAGAPKAPTAQEVLINHTTQTCATTKVANPVQFMDRAELQLDRLTESVPGSFKPKVRRTSPGQLSVAFDMRDPALADGFASYAILPSMPIDVRLTAAQPRPDSLSISWDLYYHGKDPLPNGRIFTPEQFDSLTRSFTTLISSTTPMTRTSP